MLQISYDTYCYTRMDYNLSRQIICCKDQNVLQGKTPDSLDPGSDRSLPEESPKRRKKKRRNQGACPHRSVPTSAYWHPKIGVGVGIGIERREAKVPGPWYGACPHRPLAPSIPIPIPTPTPKTSQSACPRDCFPPPVLSSKWYGACPRCCPPGIVPFSVSSGRRLMLGFT